MLKRLFLAAAVWLLAGCDLPFDSGNDHVAIRTESGELVIRNTGRTALYSFTFVHSAAVVDWTPCADPGHCDAIPPGYEGRTPVIDLLGYERRTADSATVYTWRLRRMVGGEYRVADRRTHQVAF